MKSDRPVDGRTNQFKNWFDPLFSALPKMQTTPLASHPKDISLHITPFLRYNQFKNLILTNPSREAANMQKTAIVVKKCKAHRIGIAVFSFMILVVLTVCVLSLHSAAALLLYVPPLVILAPFVLYFLTWNLRFEEKSITKCAFFTEISKFSYSSLQRVVKRYYTSERNFTVRMHFVNGKTLQFRMDAENAGKAVKVLQKHCSIKTP